MRNTLIINDGTPENTKKKQGVLGKNGPLLCYEKTYIYIGTPEHQNTHMISRAQNPKIPMIQFLQKNPKIQKPKILIFIFTVFWCSGVLSLIINDLGVFFWCSFGVPSKKLCRKTIKNEGENEY
jgi:hypothetical protein